jgi:tetratricopeptide (TPR) repeat protein
VSVSDGFHLWSRTCDVPADDVLGVQTRISNAVARSRLRKQERVELEDARRDSQRAVERALQFDPLSRTAQQLLGLGLSAQGRHAERQRQYEGLMQLYPDYTYARVALAHLHMDQGRLDEAARVLDDAAAIRADPEVGIILAQVYASLGMEPELDTVLNSIREPPAAARVAEGALLLHRKDYAALGRLADEAGSKGVDPMWSSTRLLVAVLRNDPSAQNAMLATRSGELRAEPPDLGRFTPIDALLYASALSNTGDLAAARRVALQVLRDHSPGPGEFDPPSHRWIRMAAAASAGDVDRAVAELQAAEKAGFRALVDIDYFMRLTDYPFMTGVSADPRFKAVIARIEADNRRMREALRGGDPAG